MTEAVGVLGAGKVESLQPCLCCGPLGPPSAPCPPTPLSRVSQVLWYGYSNGRGTRERFSIKYPNPSLTRAYVSGAGTLPCRSDLAFGSLEDHWDKVYTLREAGGEFLIGPSENEGSETQNCFLARRV